MLSKRLMYSLILGSLLGVVCIVGAQIRSEFSQDGIYLFAFWYNRVILGLVIGVINVKMSLGKTLLRGAILGLLVSFAFYSTIGFSDHIGFIAGIIYGVIIEFSLFKLK